ncbi:MAG: hypothetical protein ACRBDL_00690 [Alphaproteobacteria bacterium]
MLRKIITVIVVTVILGCGNVSQASDITIDEAYRSIPHGRTQFDQSRATMSEEEKKYIDHLFFATDLAMRERVVMLRYFEEKKSASYIEQYNKEIGNILASFDLVRAPTKTLLQVEKLVLESVREQQAFFNKRYKNNDAIPKRAMYSTYKHYTLVQSSHKKLIQAYMLLKKTYPREQRHNQKAFFDHLCALDFI